MPAHITSFRVKGKDYFTADLDNGRVRIGIAGSYIFDIPQDHAYFGPVSNASTEDEVELLHDKLMQKNILSNGQH